MTESPKLGTIASHPANTFSCVIARSLQMGPQSGMVTWTRGSNAWRGCDAMSGNPLTREGSLYKTGCSVGGVHLLATALGGQHAHFVHSVPYGKCLKEMFKGDVWIIPCQNQG